MPSTGETLTVASVIPMQAFGCFAAHSGGLFQCSEISQRLMAVSASNLSQETSASPASSDANSFDPGLSVSALRISDVLSVCRRTQVGNSVVRRISVDVIQYIRDWFSMGHHPCDAVGLNSDVAKAEAPLVVSVAGTRPGGLSGEFTVPPFMCLGVWEMVWRTLAPYKNTCSGIVVHAFANIRDVWQSSGSHLILHERVIGSGAAEAFPASLSFRT